MIWKRAVTLQALNAMGEGNMVGLLDIQFIRIGDSEGVRPTMPVDSAPTSRLVYCLAERPSLLAETRGLGGGVSLRCRGAEGYRARGER